jgi:carbon storage regulator
MLVLSRKFGQKFRIGEDIVITVVKIDRNSVRIGIEAPGNVSICRQELAEADLKKMLELCAA